MRSAIRSRCLSSTPTSPNAKSSRRSSCAHSGWRASARSSVASRTTSAICSYRCCSACRCSRSASKATPRRRARYRRSEEHTSELQSRGHLVCRLLLEKKKEVVKPEGAGEILLEDQQYAKQMQDDHEPEL